MGRTNVFRKIVVENLLIFLFQAFGVALLVASLYGIAKLLSAVLGKIRKK